MVEVRAIWSCELSIFLLVKIDWKIAKIWPFAPEIKIVIHNDGRLQRGLNGKKISDWYKPIKKFSRHAHKSIKPRLYQTGALEIGAEKIFLDVEYYVLRALGGDPSACTIIWR